MTVSATTPPAVDIVHELSDLVGQGRRFACIYVDPPWRYSNTSSNGAAENHYRTMSLDEITALPVAQLAADQAHLHLWTTTCFLPSALELLLNWKFEYKGMLVWVKPGIGCGNYWRSATEYLLLGVKGNLPFASKNQPSWFIAERTEHSRKPACVRRMIEKVSPPPRIELFSRDVPEGWAVWGDEVPKESYFPLFADLD